MQTSGHHFHYFHAIIGDKNLTPPPHLLSIILSMSFIHGEKETGRERLSEHECVHEIAVTKTF